MVLIKKNAIKRLFPKFKRARGVKCTFHLTTHIIPSPYNYGSKGSLIYVQYWVCPTLGRSHCRGRKIKLVLHGERRNLPVFLFARCAKFAGQFIVSKRERLLFFLTPSARVQNDKKAIVFTTFLNHC